MYKVEIQKRGEAIRDFIPDIKTISVNSARVILADDKGHMYTLRPGDIGELNIKYVEVVRHEPI